MRRLKDAWFEFKGVDSRDLGIFIVKMPQRGMPAPNYETKKVLGRDGSLRLTDGTYGDITIKLEFHALDDAKFAAIHALLSGSGPLRFSDEPEFVYDACVDKPGSRQAFRPRFAGQKISVSFTCHPFRRQYVTERQIQITSASKAFSNPGTAPARPRVSIWGSGAFELTIGDQTMSFSDVSTGIVVDSELMDVFELKGGALANDKVISGDLFVLKPCESFEVSWAPAANVTRVVIEPRWRYL